MLQQRYQLGGHLPRKMHPSSAWLASDVMYRLMVAAEPDAVLRRQRAFLDAAIGSVAVLELPFQKASIISWC